MSKFLPPRTTTAIRIANTPLKGELLFDTDLDKLFIGDGVTVGGIEVGTGVEVTVTLTCGVTSYNDLTDRPTLGTASSKNSGTGAREVLLLREANKLPALDGSLLANLLSGGTGFDRALVNAMITAGVKL